MNVKYTKIAGEGSGRYRVIDRDTGRVVGEVRKVTRSIPVTTRDRGYVYQIGSVQETTWEAYVGVMGGRDPVGRFHATRDAATWKVIWVDRAHQADKARIEQAVATGEIS